MYSWELKQFIEDRGSRIGGDDLTFVIDRNFHPQIREISYHHEDCSYTICTSDDYCFHFNAMPIDEAKSKGLIKSLVPKNKST